MSREWMKRMPRSNSREAEDNDPFITGERGKLGSDRM